MDSDAREIIVIEQFVRGLGDLRMQQHVQFGHPQTIEQAISLAGEYVAVSDMSTDLLSKPLPCTVVKQKGVPKEEKRGKTDKEGAGTDVIEALMQRIRALEEKSSSRERRIPACYLCGDTSHFLAQCPFKKRRSNTTLTQKGSTHERSNVQAN